MTREDAHPAISSLLREAAPRVPALLFDEAGDHGCTACGDCVTRCPSGSLSIVSEPAASDTSAGSGVAGVLHTTARPTLSEPRRVRVEQFDLDWSRCIGCGECVVHCPEQALELGAGFLSAGTQAARSTSLLTPAPGAS